MAIKREQKQLITFKLEPTKGLDSVPTAIANAMMVNNLQLVPLVGETHKRNNDTGFMGNQGSIRSGTHVTLTFGVELGGSGTAGTEPAYSPLYEACGNAIVPDPAVDVTLTPIDEAIKSGTFYYYADGALHKIIGSHGAHKWKLGTDGIPMVEFSFTGLYVKPDSAVVPTATFTAVEIPLAVNKLNTAVTFFGQLVSMKTLTVDPGNDVSYDQVTEDESVDMLGRDGKMNIKIREPDIATINFFDLVNQSAMGALAYQHGIDVTHAGNIFELSLAQVQLNDVKRSYDKGRAYLELAADIVPTAKNLDYTAMHR